MHPVFQAGIFQLARLNPNTGAAFGIFQRQQVILSTISLVAIFGILVYVIVFYHRFPLPHGILNRIALGLILGGTTGNMIDRLNPALKGVTDFIWVWQWPPFNVADSAISIGGILLVYCLLSLAKEERAEAHKKG
jgi:signal peptidase II